MKDRTIRGILGVALAVGASLGAATPVSANASGVSLRPTTVSAAVDARAEGAGEDPGDGPSCPTGAVCGWPEPDFVGHPYLINPAAIGNCWAPNAYPTFRSMWNASTIAIVVWEGQGCTGLAVPVRAGDGWAKLPVPMHGVGRA
jgi:hypothetical protein